jgi:signal transduction histidine kinase
MIDVKLLQGIALFSSLSDERLHWLAGMSGEAFIYPGDVLLREGDPCSSFYVLLDGELQVTKNSYGGEQLLLASLQRGAFLGEMSLLTGKPHNASVRAISDSYLMVLDPPAFNETIKSCSSVALAVAQALAERAQNNEGMIRQREKMAALGTLSAGLAHQLNNPASAATRAAGQMHKTLLQLDMLAIKLMRLGLSDEQIDAFEHFQHSVLAQALKARRLDPLAQSDLEEAMIAWMEAHGIEEGWKLAPSFVSAGMTLEQLEEIAARIDNDLLDELLFWIEGALTGVGLLRSIEQSASRISELVNAVKSYSFMDQAPLQEVDIHEGLDNTLIVIGHRLEDQIEVIRQYSSTLPRVMAYGSELNQVWTNLLDNACDAVVGKGKITIRTWQEDDDILVEIGDNGHGVAPDIQSRIFEPFFTTKPVGMGTGLGLDIVYRIVKAHRGDVRLVFSQPGDTRFQVRLPLRALVNRGE